MTVITLPTPSQAAYKALDAAIERVNRVEIGDFTRDTGLIPYVTPTGAEFAHAGVVQPINLDGRTVYARVLFVREEDVTPHLTWIDLHVDAWLVAESAFRDRPDMREILVEDIVSADENDVHDLMVVTLTRGRYNAVIAPLPDVCAALSRYFAIGETRDEPRDATAWARSWTTPLHVSDTAALDLIEKGIPIS